MTPPLPTLDQLLSLIAERISQQLLANKRDQQPDPAERSPWMSAATAAAYLDWPLQRLYKLSAQNAIPYYG
jgi:hypothetical protein